MTRTKKDGEVKIGSRALLTGGEKALLCGTSAEDIAECIAGGFDVGDVISIRINGVLVGEITKTA